ncbi:hypothetical protein [Burkholderia ambifaria]|uniref:hypothetical protein n=1 Tax=Burkholderia ambifaria TaxID=152480 RepID=UPI0013E0B00B|nr:hypothetical protein [Burkholderia ambifaria]
MGFPSVQYSTIGRIDSPVFIESKPSSSFAGGSACVMGQAAPRDTAKPCPA